MGVDGVVFIGAAIVGLTQLVKLLSEKNWKSAVTIGLAVLVGIIVALVDTEIGVVDLTVAQGIMAAFAAAGVVTTAQKIG